MAPRVFIVGAGFAGLAAARALRRAEAEVWLIDRRNHHVFQPLLYQVATASLSPAEISAPIRRIMRGQKNARVVLGEVTAVDPAAKTLTLNGEKVSFDYLIVAAGATHAYFGHDDWAGLAPGIKTLEDAIELRRRMLLAFEAAEYETSGEARQAQLTFAIVGAGATGVELAGAIKEIAGKSIPKDYKNIDTRTTRVILFQGESRVLPAFHESLSARAKRDLEAMGVEVRLNAQVTKVTAEGLNVGQEFVPVKNIFWAAGVKASPLGASLGVPRDKAGRVVVGPDLAVPGYPEIFVVGDLAAAKSRDKPVPGVAPAGIQMGRYAGALIARQLIDPAARRKPFVYLDKGSMAVIGKARAVAQIKGLKLGGIVAFFMWAFIHILTLVGFRNRVYVFVNWFFNWVVNSRDARLITGDVHPHIQIPEKGQEGKL